MNRADFVLPPCSCGECVQAGVTDLELRRDPHTGDVLHGYRLKRWYESYEQFKTLARQAVGGPGRHARGFEKLAGGR